MTSTRRFLNGSMRYENFEGTGFRHWENPFQCLEEKVAKPATGAALGYGEDLPDGADAEREFVALFLID